MINPTKWLATYHQAWLTHDSELVAGLFTDDAIYQSHPFRAPFRGRDAIRAYWKDATPSQEDLDIQWGIPLVSDNHLAVEWWATMRDPDDGELTLVGCLIVRFSPDGMCEELREYWHIAIGNRASPQAGWGQ